MKNLWLESVPLQGDGVERLPLCICLMQTSEKSCMFIFPYSVSEWLNGKVRHSFSKHESLIESHHVKWGLITVEMNIYSMYVDAKENSPCRPHLKLINPGRESAKQP